MKMRANRRQVLIGAASALLPLSAPAIAQGKPEKLVFTCVVGGWGDVLYKQAIPEFEQKTGIKIETTLLPADGLQTRLRAELLAKSGVVDLSMWNPSWAGWMAPHMSDHDALLKTYGGTPDDTDWKDLYSPAIEMASFKGKKIGLPYRVVAHVLYYQPELLTQLGIAKPPATFDEFRAAAKAITAAGDGKRFGIGYQAKVGAQGVSSFIPYLLSFGGDFLTDDYDVLINSPKSVESLKYVADLRNVDKVVPPEVLTWQADEIIAGAQTDRFGMTTVIGPWATQINGNGDATKGKWPTEGKWAYAPLPGSVAGGGRSVVSGWSIGIPETAKNREWSFRFLQHVMGKKWLLKSIEGGNLPPVSTLETDQNILTNYAWAAATAGSLKTATLEPRDDVWPTLNARLATGMSEAIAGQKTAKAALDDVAADWDRQLRRARLKR